jgi:TonB family protein
MGGEPAAKDPTPTIKLPDVVVNGTRLPEFPRFKQTEVVTADFSPKTWPLSAQYPGHAFYEGVSDGTASVGVMLDREGHATDFLLLRYTKAYFGDSLMRAAHRQLFTPLVIQGVAVPGRFNFSYAFRPPNLVVTMTSFDAINQRYEEIEGGPKFIYAPHDENEIDGGALEPVRLQIPAIPAGYSAPKGKPPRVLLTFYVDEKGRVRLPKVESAPSATLVAEAIDAVQKWKFQPPKLKGQGVLVYATRALKFREN